MNFDRIKPCKTCPFRTDENALRHLGNCRAQEIADCIESDGSFTCHDDKDKPDRERNHCVGAMLILEKEGRANQMMRIAERLRLYDRRKLVGGDEVFECFDEFVEAQSDGE